MDEMEMLFFCPDEQETDLLLKNIEEPENPVLSQAIKNRIGIEEKAEIKSFPLKKILPFAAMFIIVLGCALTFGTKTPLITTTVATTEATTTQQPPQTNPLMEAISTGNDDIIPTLLSLPGLITKETLDFALNFTNRLSYNTIHDIAVSVRESLGSTGLDGLVEKALLGDSTGVIQELSLREEMTMSPFEKLAFFFSVAFCDREVVEAFVNRGYDIHATDASGNSIYAIAEKYGNEDTMEYAVSMGITS